MLLYRLAVTFGPRVTATASASLSTPWSIATRASEPNLISFARPLDGRTILGTAGAKNRVDLAKCLRASIVVFLGVIQSRLTAVEKYKAGNTRLVMMQSLQARGEELSGKQ